MICSYNLRAFSLSRFARLNLVFYELQTAQKRLWEVFSSLDGEVSVPRI